MVHGKSSDSYLLVAWLGFSLESGPFVSLANALTEILDLKEYRRDISRDLGSQFGKSDFLQEIEPRNNTKQFQDDTNSSMPQPIIQLKNISKSYGGRQLLDAVSFNLHASEITTLIGQNGAGKTTIAKLLLGLEKPTSGELVRQKNLKVGYVPQKLDYRHNMPLNCKALLKLLAPSMRKSDLAFFDEFLDYKSVKHKDVGSISGGQLQKLLLIGTALEKPDLLILDEPTQYLDVASQQEFYRLVAKIRDEMKMSIFMISHDLFTVMKNSDRVICLNKHVCCSGKPSEFSSNKQLKSALSEIGVYVHNHDHEHEH